MNSTDESKAYSREAINLIVNHFDDYLDNNTEQAAGQIMRAANYAGRAINITQTTAPHAMSYKLTSLYRLPHGHAVAICLPEVWQYMTEHPEKCIDKRGSEYLAGVFAEIAQALGCGNATAGADHMRAVNVRLGFDYPVAQDRISEIETLAQSVNPTRLKNNPVSIDTETARALYNTLLK